VRIAFLIEVYFVVGGDIRRRGEEHSVTKLFSKNVKQRNLVKLVARKSMVTSVTTGNLVTKLTTANTRTPLSTDLLYYSL